MPAGPISGFLIGYPGILAWVAHLHLNQVARAPAIRSVARIWPALSGFTGALTLDGAGSGQVPARFPWDLLAGTFGGIHSLSAIGCVMDHRRGLMNRTCGTFPWLRSLALRGCTPLTCQGNRLVTSPWFGGALEFTVQGWNGGESLPETFGREGCLPGLYAAPLDRPGVCPDGACRMPSLTGGKLWPLQIRWINTPDGADRLIGLLAAGGGLRIDLGGFTPVTDGEWAGLFRKAGHPGQASFGFSSQRLLPDQLVAVGAVLVGSAVMDLKLGDDSRRAYRLLTPLGRLPGSEGAGRLRALSLRTRQTVAADAVIELVILPGLSRFKLAGRIPPVDYLRTDLLPRTRQLTRVELEPENQFGRTALDAVPREGLGGGRPGWAISVRGGIGVRRTGYSLFPYYPGLHPGRPASVGGRPENWHKRPHCPCPTIGLDLGVRWARIPGRLP